MDDTMNHCAKINSIRRILDLVTKYTQKGMLGVDLKINGIKE